MSKPGVHTLSRSQATYLRQQRKMTGFFFCHFQDGIVEERPKQIGEYFDNKLNFKVEIYAPGCADGAALMAFEDL